MNSQMRYPMGIRIFRLMLPVVAVLCSLAAAAQVPEKPSVPYAVNDYAGIFTSSQWKSMEQTLEAFADTTSNQIVVVTVDDLGGMEPAMFAYEIGEKWGVGSASHDNGVVVLVKPKTRSSSGQVYIAVGYGLEGAIPDAIAKRIVENEMIPHFQNEDYYGGVTAALDILMKLAAGEISYQEYESSGDSEGYLVVIIFIVLIIIFSLVDRGRRRRGYSIDGRGVHGSSLGDAIFWGSILGGGNGGSRGGSDFGGFGGGFGGGSFGGGGAGGSW